MKIFSLSLLLLIGAFYSQQAFAARAESSNTIWFDANDNVIGQDAYFCNGAHWKGGSQSGLYKIIIKGGCGDPIVSCTWVSDGIMCQYAGSVYNYTITSKIFGDYAPRTIQDACNITGACTFSEPELMFGWGFNLVQVP
jgi:hypothetical protein